MKFDFEIFKKKWGQLILLLLIVLIILFQARDRHKEKNLQHPNLNRLIVK